MRSIFLLGGFVGFFVVAVSELQAGLPGDRVLLDGAIGCLVGAVLFRWFSSSLVSAFAHAVKAKRAERVAAAEAAAAAKAATSPVKAR